MGLLESNNITKQAHRIHTFMLSSVLSSNKDVVALIPVPKMTNQDLYQMTKEVVKNVSICGYRIICILSDNNVVNAKMFMNLSGTNCLVPPMNTPINPVHNIYLLFVERSAIPPPPHLARTKGVVH